MEGDNAGGGREAEKEGGMEDVELEVREDMEVASSLAKRMVAEDECDTEVGNDADDIFIEFGCDVGGEMDGMVGLKGLGF